MACNGAIFLGLFGARGRHGKAGKSVRLLGNCGATSRRCNVVHAVCGAPRRWSSPRCGGIGFDKIIHGRAIGEQQAERPPTDVSREWDANRSP